MVKMTAYGERLVVEAAKALGEFKESEWKRASESTHMLYIGDVKRVLHSFIKEILTLSEAVNLRNVLILLLEEYKAENES